MVVYGRGTLEHLEVKSNYKAYLIFFNEMSNTLANMPGGRSYKFLRKILGDAMHCVTVNTLRNSSIVMLLHVSS